VRYVCIGATAVAALAFAAGPASAQDAPPAGEYEQSELSTSGFACAPSTSDGRLPPRDRVDVFCSPVSAPSGAGCRSVWAGRVRKSAAGIVVWRYRQEIDWCWNSTRTRITSVFRTRWGKTYVPLWHFRGHIGNATAGGTCCSYYKAFTQGKFEWCFAQIGGCVVEKHPWVTIRVYANGSWSYATG
jgi:hypothetical protein